MERRYPRLFYFLISKGHGGEKPHGLFHWRTESHDHRHEEQRQRRAGRQGHRVDRVHRVQGPSVAGSGKDPHRGHRETGGGRSSSNSSPLFPAWKRWCPSSSPTNWRAGNSRSRTRSIRVGDLEIGGPRFIVMAGPCTVESEEQLLESAYVVKKGGGSYSAGRAPSSRGPPLTVSREWRRKGSEASEEGPGEDGTARSSPRS